MKTLLLICLALFLGSLFLYADNPIGIMVKIKGDVKLIRNEKKTAVKVGDMLYSQDKLQSGAESYAAFKYVDNSSYLKLFPNSIIVINAEKAGNNLNKSNRIEKGTLYSSINSKIKGDFKVMSPTTVASVKGTKFFTQLNEDGTFYVFTLEGTVAVQNTKSGESQDVSAGNMIESNSEGGMKMSPTGNLPSGWENEINDREETQPIKIELQNSSGVRKYITIEAE